MVEMSVAKRKSEVSAGGADATVRARLMPCRMIVEMLVVEWRW